MDLSDAKAYLSVIKAEHKRRAILLRDEDPNAAYDRWWFHDAPFVNELCLVFLVSLRHEIERRLLQFAARAVDDGRPISSAEYSQRVDELKNRSIMDRWKEIKKRLKIAACTHYEAVEALRLLANAYKHDPLKKPDRKLLTHLRLDATLTYAELPESGDLQEKLALIVGLPGDAEYCEIAEHFVERVQSFLRDAETRSTLSRVRGGRVGLLDVAH